MLTYADVCGGHILPGALYDVQAGPYFDEWNQSVCFTVTVTSTTSGTELFAYAHVS
jgi:hypothetical protein